MDKQYLAIDEKTVQVTTQPEPVVELVNVEDAEGNLLNARSDLERAEAELVRCQEVVAERLAYVEGLKVLVAPLVEAKKVLPTEEKIG